MGFIFQVLLASVGSFFIQSCMGYPDGPPTQACVTFRPAHGTDFSMQVDYKDYFTISSKSTGNQDKSVKVTLRAVQDDRLFKGFMIRALPGKYDENNWEDQPMPIGSWRETEGSKRMSCFRGINSVITHSDNDLKSEASFIWLPPIYSTDNGNRSVTFVATVVENFQRHFSGVATEMNNNP